MSQDLNIPQGTFLGHPKGLYLLFATEMWERFSFYGMRALLVLYAAAATHAVNPGLGWADAQALKLYGWYLGLVYGTAIFGGWIADNWLGQRKAVILGGLVMAAGQFLLAAPLDTLGTSGAFSLSALGIAFPETPTSFYLGLVLMCVGNGFFKPNISTMVGDLYPQGDARRDGAFVIFYMGINVGAFLAPLVCSTLGEDPAYGWRVGFLRRRHRHAAVRVHPARLRAALHRRRRPRARRPALAQDGGRREEAAHAGRARSPARDLRDLHLRRDLLGDLRAGRRPHEPVRREVRASARSAPSSCRPAGSSR